MDYNPILDTDSYKLSHFLGYPEDVDHVYSYAESRGGRYDATVFFGLQPFLCRLTEHLVTVKNVLEAEEFALAHGEPFNKEDWLYIARNHAGFLPLRIKAVPEGMLVPTRNVLCTVENTDPKVPWLTSYIETALLRQLWYGTTVATRIFNMKRRIKEAFARTSDNFDNLPFALLDFSSRGCSSYGANEIGGAAYLAHFLGSDSVPAVRYVNRYYDSKMSGFSVPATEHSIMCAWGLAAEKEAFKNFIRKAGGPGKIVSIVADTYNVFEAARMCSLNAEWIKSTGTTLVFRPDSGDAGDVIPKVLKQLGYGFGGTRNSKGYYVLNGAKVLWGDGITEATHMVPFNLAETHGWAADNIITGSGGGLMQADIDRDTCKFAFKASAIKRRGGSWEGIAKDPITDPGKRSKKGRLALITPDIGCRGVDFATVSTGPDELSIDGGPDILRTVYENGRLMNPTTIDTVRERIDSQL